MDAPSPILIRNATIVTMDPDAPDLEKGDILIVEGKIKTIAEELHPKDPSNLTEIDGSGCVVIPGFVDCHRHSWEGVIRYCNPDSKTFPEYVQTTLAGFKAYVRPEDVYAGTLATAMGAIDAGITTIWDNMHANSTQEHAASAVRAWIDSGLDAGCHLMFGELGGSNEGKGEPLDVIRNGVKAAQATIPDEAKSRVSVGIFGQFQQNELQVAREDGLTIAFEFLDMLEAYFEAAYKSGQMNIPAVLNHATGLKPETWKIIKQAGFGVNVCPRSDAQWALSGGVNAYQDAINAGVRPGLSVDNESAYGGDMFKEMSVLFYMQRALVEKGVVQGVPMRVRELLAAATIDGARALGREKEIGSLTPGKFANMVMLRANSPSVHPTYSAVGMATLGADRSNVDTVIVHGKVLKRHGKLAGFDEVRYHEMIEESVEHLKTSAGHAVPKVSEDFKLSKPCGMKGPFG